MMKKQKPFVTLAQVAAAAGVSPGAASVAVRGGGRTSNIGVGAEKAEHVRNVAAKMGYKPSATARAMCGRATRQVGVILPNRLDTPGTGPMAFETINGINSGLQAAGRLLVLVRLHDVLDNVEHGSRVFREDALDGVVVVGAMPPDALRWIGKQFAKCVWCDTNFWAPRGCVRRDEAAAGRMACEHALGGRASTCADGGRTSLSAVPAAARGDARPPLIWIGNDEHAASHFSSAERLAGVEACCGEARRGLVKMTIREFASQPARRFRGQGLVAESYPVALRLGMLLGRAGMAPGRDVSLACCDDPHVMSWAWPELSRVRFDRHQMGRRAAAMMLDMLDKPGGTPESERLASEWIEGETLMKNQGAKK